MVEEERNERAAATADQAASSALSLIPSQRGPSISLERRAEWNDCVVSLSVSVSRIIASRRRELGSRARSGRPTWEVGQNRATPRSKSKSDVDAGKGASGWQVEVASGSRPQREAGWLQGWS